MLKLLAMLHKSFIEKMGFIPKESTSGIFIKKYPDSYAIEVDFEKQIFHFGGKIKVQGKDIQNITKPEDWVVLECVNRLLQKGYKPENISLEKRYEAGHGFSGRLDICVTREDGSEYLLVECKTYGSEFNKALTKLNKDGGQLFTYFKFSNKADIIMLYASELNGNDIIYKNEIVKIEDDYRTGDVKDFYQKWNKLTKDNGVLDSWVNPYNFESKALTPNLLKKIKEEDSSLIFNQFLEILRHNVVSDKPNAFNKIFTLFLCKVYDEKTTKPTEELKFQWIEGKDTSKGENAYVDFLIRLSDLYKNGMLEFLEKEITDFSEIDFERKYKHLDDSVKKELLKEFNKIRLEKNNEFAIKEVFDKQSFLENGKIVKEVVELLQGYRIRYNKRQPFLSNFFELLLTTGLKQESGQFFTPVPIAQFIIKSLPFDTIVNEKLQKGTLPYLIDYAAGSGHFLTESMHEIQNIINEKLNDEFTPIAQEKIIKWQSSHFDWATQFVYGIEKDYRLVKVGKVGCYLHGDGLANVLLSDGLGSFKTTKEYKRLLKETKEDFPQDNGQFDILVSNPPYSVSSFKRTTKDFYTENDFELYSKLTDNSSEIECLFIERTKQLLKDGGVAGIILPSSILSNTGIYSKSREIILQYFDIIGVAELGSNTFMATGTNTVTLFLRRRNNYESINLKIAVNNFFTNFHDVTLNGVEKPVTKYVNHVWEGISFDDYIYLLKKTPSKAITEHEIYKEYQKKLKAKNDKEFWNLLLEKETEKLYYFIIAYPQKVVLVKSGEKDAEKRFLGYEFSNRRGSEGIHPIQRGKNIEDCTQLFDPEVFDNPTKASTYIYKAFAGDYDFAIDEAMQSNITRHNLVDMMTFDRVEFEKNISLSVKKKVKIESRWELKRFDEAAQIIRGVTYSKGDQTSDRTDKIILTADNITLNGSLEIKKEVFLYNDFEISNDKKLAKNDIFICFSSGSKEHLGKVAFIENDTDYFAGGFMGIIRVNSKNEPKYFFQLLNTLLRQTIRDVGSGSNINNLSGIINEVKIPLPPLNIQQKIVSEIEVLEVKEKRATEKVEKLKVGISSLITNLNFKEINLGTISDFKNGLNYSRNSLGELINIVGVGDFQNRFTPDLALLEKIQIDGDLSDDYLLKKNDILVVRSNGSPNLVGRFLFIEDLNIKTSFSGFTIRIRLNDKNVNAKFLCHYLKTDLVRNKIVTDSSGSNIKSLNQTLLSNIKIPLPSLPEQQKIVSEIEKIEQKISTLQKEIEEIPKQKEAILKKYL